MNLNRRELLTGIGSICGGIILTDNALAVVPSPESQPMGDEVTAVEDLMREHGVLRRILFVYSEVSYRLHRNPSEVPLDQLQKAARLFRTFGEDYHEKKLEEAFIFPAVKKVAGPAAALVDTLIAQHNRGREITDYIFTATTEPKISTADAEKLAFTITSLVRMYRPHAAREDTVIFPAWKQTLTAKQLDETNDKFENIEHDMFGQDGFEKAVQQITEIETALGLADLAVFTASTPPK
jgi:hemerythrin-like domain-containing protein